MNNDKRVAILNRLRVFNPNPTIELIYSSSFELLIAVLLSSKTKDITVNSVTKELFSVANTPQDMLALGINRIKKYIKHVGFFNKKAENIIHTCKYLITNHQGNVPKSKLELKMLPGIGNKSVNVILNVLFKRPTIAVDTHVFRVCNRLCFVTGTTMLNVEHKLLLVVPEEFKLNCHNWFIQHGKYICLARKPRCNICFIKDLCEFEHKHS